MGTTNESVEDYLETILILSKTLPVVRAIDIAAKLGYSKSSVSIALKNLRLKDYITVENHGYIYLTDSGRELAMSIYERHEWFTKWLISLGVDLVNKAYALRNYLKEYSLIKDRSEKEVELWEYYMIYSVVLDVNEKIPDEIINLYRRKV